MQAPMYRSLLLLLYSTGLRIGEALGLTIRDVDLAEGIVTVRNTKFFKTRLVPIGPKLTLEVSERPDFRCQQVMIPCCSQLVQVEVGPTNM
jgi:integrase/recombinase XerD